MGERRDDTTETDEGDAPRTERERTPRNYYYDDGTNYEIYDPSEGEDERDEDEREAGDEV